jgi:hypothetical protein
MSVLLTFTVTFEVTTPESAEVGDADTRGVYEDDLLLRDVVRKYGRGTLVDSGRCFSTVDPERDYSSGSETYYSVHPPAGITPASYRRIARILTGRS